MSGKGRPDSIEGDAVQYAVRAVQGEFSAQDLPTEFGRDQLLGELEPSEDSAQAEVDRSEADQAQGAAPRVAVEIKPAPNEGKGSRIAALSFSDQLRGKDDGVGLKTISLPPYRRPN